MALPPPRDLSEPPGDLADRAAAQQERHEASLLAEALRLVAAAQAAAQAAAARQIRVDGAVICEDCLDPISLARLDRVPGATRCVECQELHDLQTGAYAPPYPGPAGGGAP